MKIQSVLKKYGLNEKEARVYLALLKNEDQTAFALSKAIKMPKTTVYHALDSLKEMGLVNVWKKNNIAHYGTESPRRLLTNLQEKIDLVSETLPQLIALSTQSSTQVLTKQYDGADGFKIAFEDILDTLEKEPTPRLLAISSPKLLEFMPKYFPKWLQRRMELGIFTQLIAPGYTGGNLPAIWQSNELREARIAPESIQFQSSIEIYGNKVGIFSFDDENEPATAIVIESIAVNSIFKQIFDYMWSDSSPAKPLK